MIHDIEYYIETCFVKSFREIFKQMDKDYPYNDDDELTSILISATYPESSTPLKIPALVVENVAYDLSETSLYNNFLDDIIDADGMKIGEQHETSVPFSATVTVLANNDSVAKNIAGKVINYIHYDAKEVFAFGCGMDIKALRKSPGGYRRNLPENTFAHSVSASGMLPWLGESYIMNPLVLRSIIMNVKADISSK